MEIQDIIEHCKRGNQIAQGSLFNTYYSQMYHLSRRILLNHHDAEDVLSIAFTKIFNNIKKFEYRGDDSLEKWMKTIVINEAIRFVKSKNSISYDDDLPAYEMHAEHDVSVNSRIDVEQVYSIIESMPTGYRMVFNLFALEGYSHKEISELLNISENTSKSQLRKARMYIIEKMNKTKLYGTA